MISEKKETVYLTINNHKTPVWMYGKKTNPLLFVIHGYPTAFSAFVGDLPIKYLMDKYCVAAVDLPGFGYNKQLKIDFLEFLQIVIKSIAKEKPYVIFAASFGGFIAFQYASQKPKNLKGMIIAGTPLFPYRLMRFFKPLTVFKKQFFLKHYNYLLFMKKENIKKITTPTLLLYSSKDKIAGVKYGKKLEKLLPNATLVTTNTRKHSWLLHRIDENGFLEAIEKFLSTVVKGRRAVPPWRDAERKPLVASRNHL